MSAPDEQAALISVVVPVFNEAATLGQVVGELLALPLRLEVLLIGDGSTDATPTELARLRAAHPELRVFPQSANRGKGSAVRRGIDESSGDILRRWRGPARASGRGAAATHVRSAVDARS